MFVFDLAAGEEWRVSTGGTEKKTHGLAELVARERMTTKAPWACNRRAELTEGNGAASRCRYVAEPCQAETAGILLPAGPTSRSEPAHIIPTAAATPSPVPSGT